MNTDILVEDRFQVVAKSDLDFSKVSKASKVLLRRLLENLMLNLCKFLFNVFVLEL